MELSHNYAQNRIEERSRRGWTLAVNPATPPEILEQLAIGGSAALLERIAEHPQATRPLLTVLATHAHAEVRSAVADNSNTPEEIVLALARDECADVRFAIAENARTPVPILGLLADDENPYVAHRAKSTLTRLSRETGQLVRMTPPPERSCMQQLG